MLVRLPCDDGRTHMVEVRDRACRYRPCFHGGQYHRAQYRGTSAGWVCMNQAYRGCPTNSVCPYCRRGTVEASGAQCRESVGAGCESRCIGVTVEPGTLGPIASR
jgi:hypothetical protein